MDVTAEHQDQELVFPASSGQRRLWLLNRLGHDGTAYTIPFVARVAGPLLVPALEAALAALVDRHEVLRTTFFVEGDEVYQRVSPAGPVRIDMVDTSGADSPLAAAREVAAKLLARPFDLESGPLLRVGLVAMGPEEHLLILALHHCAADGWSMGVLKRDLGELYTAEVEQRAAALPELTVQYGDYAEWERQMLRSARMEEGLAHWRRVLEGAPPLLELSTDRPRPAEQSARGARRRLEFPGPTLARLKALGQEHDATLFMTLLAGFAAVLARHTDQDTIMVGTPVAGRNRVELEDLIGFFTNTLALRTDLGDDPTFSELLRQVRDATLEAWAHQDVPFEKLVAELNPTRSLSHAPIFQTLFALNHAGGSPMLLAGVDLEVLELDRGTAKFDLSLVVLERDDGLTLSCEYATDLFDADTIDGILSRYRVLLEAVTADPRCRVSELPLMTEDERGQALALARTATAEAPVDCLHHLFARQVERAPDAPALVHEGTMLTYGQLDRRANQLAHRLRALGVSRGVPVALCLERSVDMIVAVLATIKAGGAYVPLDPGYPADRLAFILEDARPPVVVVHEHTVDQLPPHEGTVLNMDSEARSLAAEPATLPESASEPSDLAYVIYTSGSTGMPKGVEVEHRHVARLFSSTDEWFGFGPGDTWALLHSYAFDFSVWEMWGALLHGGKLVVPSRMTIRSPEALAILLVLERVTVLNATPSLFSGLMGHLLGVADRMSLRTVVFGGEELRPTALAPWFDRFGSDGPALVNMYGITETTVHVTYKPLGPESAQAAGSPIGRPLPDLEIHLLDPAGRHVPRGVAGEIFVGGAGVARGYLNRPELTAERFVPNPFGTGRLYRSGDRARQLRDGGLDYLGRGDEQVKVRGFRIELGEIERALAEHPAVSEAAVTAVEVAPGDTRLAAYLVPVNGSAGLDDLPAALQAHAKRKLPPHMVPASVGVVERLPLTTNGKLNRAALPAPTWGTAKASVAPRTLLEQQLAQLWREILDVGQVGADDGFFELGGHSLLAVRLFAEIEQRFGVRLPLATLFHGDTLAELAATIAAEQAASRPWSPIVPLRAEGSRPPLIVISLGNLNSDFLPYRQLVAQLGDDQPVYGLQSPGMDGRTLPLGTVEELAAHYVRELRTFQPGGPHLLLGLAFAGMVAYETARQLIEAGEPVVLLAMLHSAPYGRKSEPPLHGADPRTWGPWIRNRGHNLHHKLGLAYYDHLVRKGRKRPRRSPWDLHLMASSRARQTYVAPPSDARIDFFGVASERHERYAARWEPLARGGLEYHAVVGTEDDTWRLVYLTRPHVDRIAEALRRVMDTRLEEWTGSS